MEAKMSLYIFHETQNPRNREREESDFLKSRWIWVLPGTVFLSLPWKVLELLLSSENKPPYYKARFKWVFCLLKARVSRLMQLFVKEQEQWAWHMISAPWIFSEAWMISWRQEACISYWLEGECARSCLLADVGQNWETCLDTLKGDSGHGLFEGISLHTPVQMLQD